MARLPAKFMLLLFGVLLSAVGLEVILQLSSAGLHAVGYRAAAPKRDDGRVVLSVGDSHTYGTSVPRADSYPAQLEGYLNRHDPEGRYQVVNRGVPGLNSTLAAQALPLWLAQSKPDLVVVWIGANNWWNRAGSEPESSSAGGSIFSSLLAHSRLLRLIRMLQIDASGRESLSDPDALHERILKQSLPWLRDRRSRSDIEFLDVTINDLTMIGEILEAQDIEWMLVTYPLASMQGTGAKRALLERAVAPRKKPGLDEFRVSKKTQEASEFVFALQQEAVRDISQREQIPFVDTTADLTRAQAGHPEAKLVCGPPSSELELASCLFVHEMGPHPTGLLYGFIAESIGRSVLERLGCVGACGPPSSVVERERQDRGRRRLH